MTNSVAIAGAGISGLACAIALRQLDWDVTVYETFSESHPIGSGLMLQPAGLLALERLGLRDRLEALGHKIVRLSGSARGKIVFELSYADLNECYYALAVHRGALHGALWSGFHHCGARLVTSTRVSSVQFHHPGGASFVTDSGEILCSADLLVDASGSSSKLRSLATTGQPRAYEYGALWATVPDIEIAPNALVQRYIDASAMIGYLPVGRLDAAGEALAAFFWSIKPREFDEWRHDFDAWRQRVVDMWPQMRGVVDSLDSPDDLSLATYTQFTPSVVATRNLVFIGDAAHATSPQLGQGANQGLIDAVVLAGALQRSCTSQALKKYALLRRPHVSFYQRASAVMTPFFQSDSRVLAAVRDLSFNRMKSIPWLHREMLRTLMGLKTGVFSSAAPDALVNPWHP